MDDIGDVTFTPPLWQQRYTTAVQLLEERKVKTVVDFGCAECKLLPLMRRIPSVEELVGVDIDLTLLESRKNSLKPLIADYLSPRDRPLRVRLFEGSVSTHDSRLDGFQAVTMIEVIEHLEANVLTALPSVLFGQLRPQLVFITTPNAEFNVLFPNFTGMRHDDHKFEWTRVEFQKWCSTVCAEFAYDVVYGGVGEPPPGHAELGPCTQMATFTRRLLVDYATCHIDYTSQVTPYKLVVEEVYPHRERPVGDAALLTEAEYHMRHLAADCRLKQDYDGSVHRLPVEDLLAYRSVSVLSKDVSTLTRVLKEAGYHLTDDGLDILVDDDTDGEEDTDDCVYPPEGSDWAPRTPGGSDWAPRTPGGSDWAPRTPGGSDWAPRTPGGSDWAPRTPGGSDWAPRTPGGSDWAPRTPGGSDWAPRTPGGSDWAPRTPGGSDWAPRTPGGSDWAPRTPGGSDWAPRTPGGSDWAPRTPGGSDWAESIEQQDGDWLPADISEERWSDDDGTTQHVVPYMDMWEDAEGEEGPSATLFSVEPCRAPRLDLPPPDSGVEPDMVYVPSVLHAASTLQVAARGAWRGDDRPGLPPRRSEHPIPTVPNSVHITHLLTVEPGQFDDDTTCTDLNLQLAAFEQLHIKSELT